MNLVDSVLATPRVNEEAVHSPVDDDNMMDDGSMQVRTMEVPRWLSTPHVTSEYCLHILLGYVYILPNNMDSEGEFLVMDI